MVRADDAGYELTNERSICLGGTREELLDALRLWTANASSPPVFWLSGHAGSGKTTIAQTYAEELAREYRLGASFFCSRNSSSRSDLTMIFITLAFQLARGKDAASSAYRTALLRALKDHPNVRLLSLRNQLEYLIIDPATESGLTTVVIIDALDESKDDNPTSTILDLLASNIHRIPKVKFFITSRPEPHIRKGFRLPQLKPFTDVFRLHEAENVDVDIKKYLKKNLTDVAIRQSQADLFEDWPSESDLDALTKKSDGLFIHASTVVKILSHGKADPQEKLRKLLEHEDDYTREGKTQLDQLYLDILTAAVKQSDFDDKEEIRAIEKTLRAVLGFLVVARDTVTATTLGDIVVIGHNVRNPKRSILSALRDLHSLVLVPDKQTQPIRFHHKSFPDFLMDSSRCTDPRFQINRDEYEFATAKKCLEVMDRKLKRNICGLKRYAMNDTLDVSQRDNYIDESLRYSCQYWNQHVLSDSRYLNIPSNSRRLEHLDAIRTILEEWFTTRLLHWLEVLSLLHELGQAVRALSSMRDWFTSVRYWFLFRHQ
jgi:hypothetical protein